MAKRNREQDAKLLETIRKRFTYAQDAWREIRREGSRDMRYVAGDPWERKQRKAREDAGRPCLSLDEIGQYVNQVINDVRQNKRAILVTPMGSGANDKTAQLHQNLIRQIEYRSNAQQAYTSMFEDAVQRSYGYLRVKPKYLRDDSFDQELVIEPVPNPDLVTVDPDHQRIDGSDMQFAFIRESRTLEEFQRQFPKAEVRDFNPDHELEARDWVDLSNRRVWLAEYWAIEHEARELLLLQGADGQTLPAFADELPDGAEVTILRKRTVDTASVVQYLTNGVEILEQTDWPGASIPVVTCYGKVIYVDEGKGAERKLLSLVRLARDPAMLYAYYRTCEAELVGMTPKTPFIGYEGQFRGHETDWQKAAHEPVAYLEAAPTTEATGPQVLPLPQRQPYEPPIQALEIGAEAARRAIQAAMGTNFLPTQAQRRNEKSGIALKQIEETAQKGSYHFVDHYDAAITRTGAILEELLPHYYDTTRDVTVRKPDDTVEQTTINDPNKPETAVSEAPHDVTLSTGPSYDSEREAASDFADLLVQNPQVFPLLADMVVKLKNLGPIGDEMSDRLKILLPPEIRAMEQQKGDPQAMVAQLLGELQKGQQMFDLMAKELEAKTKLVETDAVKAEADLKKAEMDNATRLKVAEIQAQTAVATAEIKAMIEDYKLRLGHIEQIVGHAAGERQQMAQQGHEAGMAAMGQQHEDAQRAAGEGHEAQMAQGDRQHQAQMQAEAQQAQMQQAQMAQQSSSGNSAAS